MIRRFLKLKSWRDTECIIVGGGFRASRIGELAIARREPASERRRHRDRPPLIDNDPDEAALIGTGHLLPAWMIEGYDAMLAADIGGTNLRAGVVELNLSKAKDLSKRASSISNSGVTRRGEVKREHAVEELVSMFTTLMKENKTSASRTGHRPGLPGCHPRGWLDRAWRAESPGQLGEQQFQSAARDPRAHSAHRRARDRRRHAQRCGRAGTERDPAR